MTLFEEIFLDIEGEQEITPIQIKENKGHIINVSSILGLIGMSTQSAYNAAKFAVAGFSEALRLEMLEHDVRVSTVFPGGVRTKIATRTTHATTDAVFVPRFERDHIS